MVVLQTIACGQFLIMLHRESYQKGSLMGQLGYKNHNIGIGID